MTVVPPGKKAWPYHSHYANEEMFVVIAGEGTLRYGGDAYPVKPGDVILCKAGGEETTHGFEVSTGATKANGLGNAANPRAHQAPRHHGSQQLFFQDFR